MSKQAIIYTRFSPRPNAKECDSCEKQKERCMKHIEDHYLNSDTWNQSPFVVLYFSDEAISGGDFNRPGLSEAIDLLRPDDVLIVDNSSRLARDMLVNLTIRHQVEQAGATIEFADGSPQATTPEGKLLQNILAAFAAYERDRIKANTKRGIARNRALGKKINGNIPTGMKEDPENPGMLIKCPRERKGILLACKWKREWKHETRNQIAIWLDEQVGPYRGNPWSGRLVDKIVTRNSYWADPAEGDLSLEPEFF